MTDRNRSRNPSPAAARQWPVAKAEPLLAYLLGALKLKRGAVKNLLKFGAVTVNGAVVRQFDHPLTVGDVVSVASREAAAATGQLQRSSIQIVYEDEALIVVDKPAGLLTVATDRESLDTLYVRLNAYLRQRDGARAAVVHRIDRETSGLVLLAKSEAAKTRLQESWPAVEKRYLAVVHGAPAQAEGTISNYLSEHERSLKVTASDYPRAGSRLAVTHYAALKTVGERTLVEVRLETGRKHQIRVHLAGLGCPVVGDRRYGAAPSAPRLALHACGLRLTHPLTGQPLCVRSPLPAALRKLLG